jgi:alpha-L-rhamnosidase
MKLALLPFALLASLSCLRAEPGIVQSEFIFESAPFPQCHASTIVETPDGFLAAWFGGTKEGAPDVGIWSSQWKAGAWSAPREIANGLEADGKRFPCFNPVLFQPPTGPLLLFYKAGASPKVWRGFRKTSTDEGATWSAAELLPAPLIGPVKNKPVLLSDGALLSGSSTEQDGWKVHFERSTDLGQTWQFIGPVNDGQTIGAIQPSILFLGGTRLAAVGRTRQGHVFKVESPDNGATWGAMSLLDLPNPNSGTDALTLKDGRHLLVFNNSAKGRSPMNVALSHDAATWKTVLTLDDEPGKEFSYPAVIQARDGLVHIVYTWHRQRVRHVVLDPQTLVE